MDANPIVLNIRNHGSIFSSIARRDSESRNRSELPQRAGRWAHHTVFGASQNGIVPLL